MQAVTAEGEIGTQHFSGHPTPVFLAKKLTPIGDNLVHAMKADQPDDPYTEGQEVASGVILDLSEYAAYTTTSNPAVKKALQAKLLKRLDVTNHDQALAEKMATQAHHKTGAGVYL